MLELLQAWKIEARRRGRTHMRRRPWTPGVAPEREYARHPAHRGGYTSDLVESLRAESQTPDSLRSTGVLIFLVTRLGLQRPCRR